MLAQTNSSERSRFDQAFSFASSDIMSIICTSSFSGIPLKEKAHELTKNNLYTNTSAILTEAKADCFKTKEKQYEFQMR